jgi:hypothetical protein
MLARSDGRPRQLTAMTVAIAQASATITAHTPATACSEVAPQYSSARNEKSRRGRTRSDITRLTISTTTSGSAARPMVGKVSL